jgi:hypothetical protein
VLGAHGWTVESEESNALEDAIDNRLAKVFVVKNLPQAEVGLLVVKIIEPVACDILLPVVSNRWY